MSQRIHDDVMEALGAVLDPCSVFNRTNLSLIELGMVDEVEVEDDRVYIRLFLDDPTCIFFFEIHRLLNEAVLAVDGVADVSVEIKADELWTEEERMTPEGRARLERIRAERRAATQRPGTPGWPLPMVAAERPSAPTELPMLAETGR